MVEKKEKRTKGRGRNGKNSKKEWRSILEGVPKNSSSLVQAYRLTQRASRVGFDWPNVEGVLNKLDEETREFKQALSLQNRKKIYEEIGDLLFVMVNLSRFLRMNPEEALKKALGKFISRFHHMEASLRKQGRSLRQSNLIEMEQLWEESKRMRKGSK